jgi:hypothetical protein
LFFQARSSDEFSPLPLRAADRRALAHTAEVGFAAAHKLGIKAGEYFAGRTGTAAALRSLNREWGEEYFAVPEEAATDPDAARATFSGDEAVIDVQTHYIARERSEEPAAAAILEFIRHVAPERWGDLRGGVGLSLADYLRCIYLESETAVAVLTSAPGEDEQNILTGDEIAGTRELCDRLAGSGRLLHHAIVHPNLSGEIDAMEALLDRTRPNGWKVYTLYGNASRRHGAVGWRLDDDETGLPFLERSRDLGVRIVCAHKGLSFLSPTGSPADIGPAARAFPEIDLLVYHSGYETAGEEEGPYPDEGPAAGSDRLVRSLRDAGVAAGSNVYAELGSTWFALVRRPRGSGPRAREAAARRGRRQPAVGDRLDLVRLAPTPDRRVPRLPDPRVTSRAPRLSGTHARPQGESAGP